MTIIIRSVFEEGGKLYPQVFLDDALYELLKCLQYKKISISEGIDTNETSASKECEICHYFEPHVCNKCHDVLMTAYELKNIVILNGKRCWF